MKMCNDPKCPLNRQGVPHEIHELIENRKIKNPCMDGRCAMNRMGILHDLHDIWQVRENQRTEFGTSSSTKSENDSKLNKLSREQIETQRKKIDKQRLSREQVETERRHIEQNRIHSQTILEKPTSTKPKPKPGLFSRFSSKSNIPSANQILQSHDPYVIFGLKPDTTCDEIKSKFRELSRTYNAARGSLHKSIEEKDQINAIQSRINTAYDTLKKRHCG